MAETAKKKQAIQDTLLEALEMRDLDQVTPDQAFRQLYGDQVQLAEFLDVWKKIVVEQNREPIVAAAGDAETPGA